LLSNVNVTITGRIGLNRITDKNKLLTLEQLINNSIFNKNSELYIYAPNQHFVFGPENGIIYEGDSFTVRTITFCEEVGICTFKFFGERDGFNLDENGTITTVENGINDSSIEIQSYYITNSESLSDSCTILIKKRVYPTSIRIEGNSKIETSETYE
jgi:hypothetical protein